MPDWERVVRSKLATLNLPRDEKEEVIAELASHLEDSADTEPETSESGNSELAHLPWHRLVRAIQRTKCKEGGMNHRTKTVWLPSIAIVFAAGLVLMLLDRAAFLQRLIWIACMAMFLYTAASEANRLSQRARSLWLPAMVNLTLAFGLFIILDGLNVDEPGIATAGHIAKAFRIPWLLPLPALGAVGALLARQAHASLAQRLIAGLAPSLVWMAVLVVLGLIFTIDQRDFAEAPLRYLPVSAIGLVILPALALALGALPFLRDSKTVALQQD